MICGSNWRISRFDRVTLARVWPSCAHMNCANCYSQADSNDSFYHAGSTEARNQAEGRSAVRWDEEFVPMQNQEETIHTPLDQTPDMFAPSESTYQTARTSCCSREPLMNSESHSGKTCERRTLAFYRRMARRRRTGATMPNPERRAGCKSEFDSTFV